LNAVRFSFDECKLGRKVYAEALVNLIRKENHTDSYVIALDSPWGMGKTTFINMLADMITKDSEYSDIKIAMYNAWESDYCNNAFSPLFYDLIKANSIFDRAINQDVKQKILHTIPGVIRAFTRDIVNTVVPLANTVEALENAAEMISSDPIEGQPYFEEMKMTRDAVSEFKTYLKNTTGWLSDGKKLLVVIDELDRCRPLFAIQTLEVIKHLFDIKNIVFLLAVDFSQLRYSVSTVYGQKMDSDGYLRRFVNHVFKFPDPPQDKYASYLLDSWIKINPRNKRNVPQDLQQLFSCPSLSLRDMNMLNEDMQIFFNRHSIPFISILGAYPYFFAILIKNFDAECYNAIQKGEGRDYIFKDKLSDLCERLREVKNGVPTLTLLLSDWPHIDNRISEIKSLLGGYKHSSITDVERDFFRYIEKSKADKRVSVCKHVLAEIEFFS